MGVFQDGEVGGLVPKGTKKRKTKRKAKLGVKDLPWFTFIPFDHFTVPLLHCLVGIGDNILTKFRDIVSEEIEYLPCLEIETRLSAGSTEENIERSID